MICTHGKNDACFTKVSLFQHLDPADATLLTSLLHTQKYHKGEYIVQ